MSLSINILSQNSKTKTTKKRRNKPKISIPYLTCVIFTARARHSRPVSASSSASPWFRKSCPSCCKGTTKPGSSTPVPSFSMVLMVSSSLSYVVELAVINCGLTVYIYVVWEMSLWKIMKKSVWITAFLQPIQILFLMCDGNRWTIGRPSSISTFYLVFDIYIL